MHMPQKSPERTHIIEDMSSCTTTPSPSPPNQGAANASRRPPRKSTLTQQQKNQKRQRATQEQLVTLEAEFNKNPTPTALVRERIALEINMTERSVQIWFQNRCAIPVIFVDCLSQLLTFWMQARQDQDFGEEEHRDWRGLRRNPRVYATISGIAGDGVGQGLLYG
jgi:hypothetical protein